MENLLFALNVVFPIFALLTLGKLSRSFGFVKKETLNDLNHFIFRLPLPLLLFMNIYNMDRTTHINDKTLTTIVLIIISLSSITLLLSIILNKTKVVASRKGVLVQSWFRGNIIFFGLPVVTSLYGNSATPIISTIIMVAVPLVNILAVIVLESYRGNDINLFKLILSIFKNPLLDAAIIGFILYILNINLPKLIITPLTSLSKTATPLAFIILGGTLEFSKIGKNLKAIIFGCLGRLIIVPSIIITVAILLGLKGQYIGALIGSMASPVAVSSFTMAKEMDGDGELAAQLVVISTFTSVITIFLWIYILKSLSLL